MNNLKSFCQRLTWIFTFISLKLFSSFKVVGRENLKNLPRPLLIIANHRSFWDPLVIGTLFPLFSKYLPIGFMVADAYYDSPLKPIFWLTNTCPARKGRGLDASLAAFRLILKDKGVAVIFPIGKRHYLGRPPRPRRGAAVLALETAQLTILPLYLKTVSRWKITDFFWKRKKIQIIIGRPFKLNEITFSRDVNEVTRFMAKEIFKLNK